MRLRFGDCVFDPDTRQVFRDEMPVAMAPKVFQLLEILLADRPKAVPKSAIHERLWPDTFVSDANLANLIADLREALGDDARDPHIIRTVQRFGYAFQAEARPAAPAAGASASVFRLIWGDREIALVEGDNVLGRDSAAVAWIDVYSVSRHHAKIVVSGESATLEDLGSKNGTFLRGEPVRAAAELSDGDEIRIGTAVMTVRRFSGQSTQTVRSL